jgi:hypothetical protein
MYAVKYLPIILTLANSSSKAEQAEQAAHD